MDHRDVGTSNHDAPEPEALRERIAMIAASKLDLWQLLDLVELAEAMARGEQTKVSIGEGDRESASLGWHRMAVRAFRQGIDGKGDLNVFWFVFYVAAIVGANALLKFVGTVTVAPGLLAPAGVWMIGVCYIARNQTQETLGRRWSVAAIPVGAALSAILSPEFALASGVSVLLAESLDYLIYTPLRKKGRIRAMTLSCLAGDMADSILFLALAFHSLAFLEGQLIGKWETVGVAILVMAWSRGDLSLRLYHSNNAG